MDEDKVALKPNKKFDHVFAIVRVDTFHELDVPFEKTVTVKKVVWTEKIAEQEVERLNKLNASVGAVYFWQLTRLERPVLNDV